MKTPPMTDLEYNAYKTLSSYAVHALRPHLPWKPPNLAHKMEEHPTDFLAVKLNRLYNEIAGASKEEDLQNHGRRMIQILNDISHLTKEEAERGANICEDMLNLAFPFGRLMEYAESLPKTQEYTQEARDFYFATTKARDVVTGEWVNLAHEIGDVLRTRKSNMMSRLNPLEDRLDRIIEFALILALSLMYPHKVAKHFVGRRTSWAESAAALPNNKIFATIHRDALRDLNERCNKLKDQAKTMIVDAAHIEEALEIEVPSPLLDPLFDLLLDEFKETKTYIDEMGGDLHKLMGNVSETMIFEHASIWEGLDIVTQDIKKFQGKIKDKSAYRDVATRLAQDGHDSVGAYLVDLYTGEQSCSCPCCSSRKAIPQKLSQEHIISYTYAIDNALGTLPRVPTHSKYLVDGLVLIHKRMRRVCWNSIRRIDSMLYNSNLSFRAREMMRIRTVTMRIAPLLIHTARELKGLRDPALRFVVYRRVTEAAVERQKDWLSYMETMGSWAISYVREQTRKAGRLSLSLAQKEKILAGRSDVPLGCQRRLQAKSATDEEGAISEDDSAAESDHRNDKRKPRKSKKKARAGKRHK